MIKNFIYLDREKLQSLSSQLFNGVSEYIVSQSSLNKESSSTLTQKGITKDTIIADILNQNNSESEKKFLDDYLYLLFEDKLLEKNKILDINNTELNLEEISFEKKFIKVKSKIIINDNKIIINTLEKFTEIVKAFNNVTTFEKRNLLKASILNTSDNSEKRILKQELEKISNQTSISIDKDFLKDLSYLIEYGYDEQFEIQMDFKNKKISSNLKREYLRENENLLIRKYSRHTEIEFTLLGVITQSNNKFNLEDDLDIDFNSIKKAIYNIINHITNIETQFIGRLDNEIVVDPIAIYFEL
jgi:hypothetical protein